MPNMEILKWRDVVDASDFQFSLLRYPCRMYGQSCCILEFCAKNPVPSVRRFQLRCPVVKGEAGNQQMNGTGFLCVGRYGIILPSVRHGGASCVGHRWR